MLYYILVNINQNSMKSKFQEIPSHKFFRKIKNSQRKEIEYLERELESFCIDSRAPLKKKKIVLLGLYLVIEDLVGHEYQPTHIIELDQHLKFERIAKTVGTETKVEHIHGFSLVNEKGKQTTFNFQTISQAQLWVGNLSRTLIEVGFHLHYEVLNKIGNGSTASVFVVRRLKDGQLFAAKVFSKQNLKETKKKQSFFKEIEILLAIQHQNILKTYGVFQSDTSYYVISDLLIGGSLLDRINYCRGLSMEQIKKVMQGIMKGLAYLHKFGIMHRDIKLENVMLRSLDSWEVVIVDFGLAVMSSDDEYIHYRCGTPGYISPEVINMKGKEQLDVICDVFSAGVLFHVILTHRFLFPGSSSQEIYDKNKTFAFDLKGEMYQKIDIKAMNMLKSMLELDHRQRITSEDCLDHSFLEEPPMNLVKQIDLTEVSESGSFCYNYLF